MRNSEEKIFIMCLLTEEKQKKEKDREKILCAKFIEERKVSLAIPIVMPGEDCSL